LFYISKTEITIIMQIKVLVIIVSYNFERWINRCLGSLHQTSFPIDVVVVDNCSQDATVQMITTNYPEVRLIVNTRNLGFGQANNIGIKIALQEGYDAVFLLNQDAWIAPKTIGLLVELYQKNPQFGVLSPVHLTGKGDKPDYGFSVYTGINKLTELSNTENLVKVPFVNAAFWLIPTSVLRTVGGFSPLFYHNGEDKDYVNRLKYYGYFVGYAPAAFAYHDRENRPVSCESMLRMERNYLLTEYSNINYSFSKAFGYGVLAGIKKLLKALIKKDKQSISATKYIGITCRVFCRTCEVLRCRSNYKHTH
jgi:GT2 family glycosyltransferase